MTSAVRKIRPVLVTGGAGFIGSNLADRLASEGEHVLIYDALVRPGVERNVAWLRARHGAKIALAVADVRDAAALGDAVKEASAIFHFAAQVAVTSSLLDPLEDCSVNLEATIRLLESIRKSGARAPLIFASTNKVYGDLADIELAANEEAYQPRDEILGGRGISEERSLEFHTPYGCSKGAAEQYVLDYARSFGLPTAVMRMSCIYGPRQMGTEDQGWVAHFLLRVLAGEPITIFGDGRQVRDLLFVDDAVEAYVRARRHIGKIGGRAFNLGGGPANAVSLMQLIAYAERLAGRKIELDFQPWRAGDQRYYVSDTRRIARELGLAPPLAWRAGVERLFLWLSAEHGDLPARRKMGA
ncbi:MAG TPA: SDR family NAD(P)-dependent oxidoreductase [Methylovirgula sp.]|nr:SDR family NAD(P)-dependent oxidoreductase [Methylovirgula sp.]